MALAAKDIFRVDLSKLIRFWVRERPDPTKNPKWVELGHFFAGFDYKLQRVREVDGHKRENALGFEATGTFRLAQNAIADYQNYQSLLTGPLAVAMLVGRTWEPTHGKLVVHDWVAVGDGTYIDNRIALVGDPDYNTQLGESGTISGFITSYDMYLIQNLTFVNGSIGFKTLDSLNFQSAISPTTNLGIS